MPNYGFKIVIKQDFSRYYVLDIISIILDVNL